MQYHCQCVKLYCHMQYHCQCVKLYRHMQYHCQCVKLYRHTWPSAGTEGKVHPITDHKGPEVE